MDSTHDTMGYVLLVLIPIIAILLGAVILVQNPKGTDLAAGFESAGKIGGVQRTTDFLEKATWYLTAALFVLCIAATGAFSAGTAARQRLRRRIRARHDRGPLPLRPSPAQ